MAKASRGLFFLIILLFFGMNTLAQKGKLTGVVMDGKTGETLIGVNVIVKGTTTGTITDLDGKYTLPLDPGTYEIKVSYISYQPKVFTGVEIKSGEITRLDVRMKEATVNLQEVVVTAKARRNTETALMTLQRKSAQLMDGISAEQMSDLGDSDAADALKRVTGVAVQEGKYVYVRGLGDRYSKITLNKAEIPGLDPNRNTVQMDLFPSNVIENIVVHKSFTPDLPASFTGGHVNIETKDFPEKFNLQFSASFSYNQQANLNEDFITYDGGGTDWLGIDDGSRDVPNSMQNAINNSMDPTGNNAPSIMNQVFFSDEELNRYSSGFSNQVLPKTEQSFLNQSYEFGLGNQTELFGNPLGYNIAVSYDNDYSFYGNGTSAFYEAKMEPSPLVNYKHDSRSENEAKLAGLFNVNYKLTSKHKVGFTFLRNQAGNQITRFRSGPFPYESQSHITDVNELGYLERNFSSYQLNGSHMISGLGDLEIDWLSSYTTSRQNEPDLRIFNTLEDTSKTNSSPEIKTNNGPTRTYRYMNEINFDNKLDFTLPVDVLGNNAKIKFGGAFVYKERSLEQKTFEIKPNDATRVENGFENYLQQLIIDPADDQFTGYYYETDINDDLKQSYNGESYVAAGYAMIDLPMGEKWRLITGLRLEASQIDVRKQIFQYEGQDVTGPELKETDILPSLALTYHAMENMNIRASASRTLARPVFQEVSSSQFYDYQEGIRKYGNPNLERSLITNLDLRWEYFYDHSEMVSVSLFYKNFDKPIALRYQPQTVNPEIIYFNSDQAQAYGFELELKTKLDFVPSLKNFFLGGNFSLIHSVVNKPKDEVNTINNIRERLGYDKFKETRPMFGQAPYLINAYLKYDNKKAGLSANLGYNIAGEKLSVITKGYAPYIYEQPRNSLNFNVSKAIGDNFSIKLGASNMLDAPYEAVHHFDYLNNSNQGDYKYYSYKLGRTYKLSLKYFIK